MSTSPPPSTIKTYPTLYHKDRTGAIRTWFMQRAGDRYRVVSGHEDGAKVTSGWKVAHPKNEGRKNATTGETQADAEVLALYKKKRAEKYHDTKEAVAGAKFIEPMLAQEFKRYSGEFLFFAQPKLDGIRCIATRTGLWSRKGKKFTSCQHIEAALAEFFADHPDVVLDGELYNHKLRDNFGKIASQVRAGGGRQSPEVEYHVYDAMSPENFGVRSSWLTENVPWGPSIHRVETFYCNSQERLDEAYGRFLEQGYEGQMVRLDAPYEPGTRSKTLMKRKEFETKEFPVSRIMEGQGNWAGHAKRVEFILPDDKRTKTGERPAAGVRGDKATLKQLLRSSKSEKGAPKAATIRFQGYTPDGIPRFPVAVDFQYGSGERID